MHIRDEIIMKKRSKNIARLLFAVLAVAYASVSIAQNNQQAIKNIRSRYQAVNSEISSKGCQSNKTLNPEHYDTEEQYSAVYCPYYHSVLSENQRNKPVSAVGAKQVRTDFWFTDEAGEYRLHKVNKTTTLSYPQKISQEYLYDENNNLIFYYKHAPIYDNYDTRLYFHNGKLIKALPKDFSESVDAVLRKAKNFVITAEF